MSSSHLKLMDWRNKTFGLYAAVRSATRNINDAAQACVAFRAQRDALFASHPSTPLDDSQRAGFASLPYFDHNPYWRTLGTVEPLSNQRALDIAVGEDGTLNALPVARVTFELAEQQASLIAYWLQGYGGGLWLPFGDATNGTTTYGGGRYLFDTIKGADLGTQNNQLVLDFNYAYNPSCAYNPRWVCPLTPPENRLKIAIEAGERLGEFESNSA